MLPIRHQCSTQSPVGLAKFGLGEPCAEPHGADARRVRRNERVLIEDGAKVGRVDVGDDVIGRLDQGEEALDYPGQPLALGPCNLDRSIRRA